MVPVLKLAPEIQAHYIITLQVPIYIFSPEAVACSACVPISPNGTTRFPHPAINLAIRASPSCPISHWDLSVLPPFRQQLTQGFVYSKHTSICYMNEQTRWLQLILRSFIHTHIYTHTAWPLPSENRGCIWRPQHILKAESFRLSVCSEPKDHFGGLLQYRFQSLTSRDSCSVDLSRGPEFCIST